MNGYDSQFIRDRLRDKSYLPLAYFEGATPDNSYTPTEPYIVNVYSDPRPQDCEAGYIRLFLKTAGADSARPIRLRQKGANVLVGNSSIPFRHTNPCKPRPVQKEQPINEKAGAEQI